MRVHYHALRQATLLTALICLPFSSLYADQLQRPQANASQRRADERCARQCAPQQCTSERMLSLCRRNCGESNKNLFSQCFAAYQAYHLPHSLPVKDKSVPIGAEDNSMVNSQPQPNAGDEKDNSSLHKRIAELEAELDRYKQAKAQGEQGKAENTLETLKKEYQEFEKGLSDGTLRASEENLRHYDKLLNEIARLSGQSANVNSEEAGRKKKLEEQKRLVEEKNKRDQAIQAADRAAYSQVVATASSSEVGRLLANEASVLKSKLVNAKELTTLAAQFPHWSLSERRAVRHIVREMLAAKFSTILSQFKNELDTSIDNAQPTVPAQGTAHNSSTSSSSSKGIASHPSPGAEKSAPLGVPPHNAQSINTASSPAPLDPQAAAQGLHLGDLSKPAEQAALISQLRGKGYSLKQANNIVGLLTKEKKSLQEALQTVGQPANPVS